MLRMQHFVSGWLHLKLPLQLLFRRRSGWGRNCRSSSRPITGSQRKWRFPSWHCDLHITTSMPLWHLAIHTRITKRTSWSYSTRCSGIELNHMKWSTYVSSCRRVWMTRKGSGLETIEDYWLSEHFSLADWRHASWCSLAWNLNTSPLWWVFLFGFAYLWTIAKPKCTVSTCYFGQFWTKETAHVGRVWCILIPTTCATKSFSPGSITATTVAQVHCFDRVSNYQDVPNV